MQFVQGFLHAAVHKFFDLTLDNFLVELYNFFGHSLLSPFRMVCANFILPESANYVFFFAFSFLRNLSVNCHFAKVSAHILYPKLRHPGLYQTEFSFVYEEFDLYRSLAIPVVGHLDSSLLLRIISNGTFRNVPLLLPHACPCAVRFDAYQFSKTALLDAHHKGGIKQGCFSVLKKTSDCKSNDRVTGAGRGRGSPGCGPGSSTACRCSRRCASRRSSWTGRCCRTAGTSRPAYRPCPL